MGKEYVSLILNGWGYRYVLIHNGECIWDDVCRPFKSMFT